MIYLLNISYIQISSIKSSLSVFILYPSSLYKTPQSNFQIRRFIRFSPIKSILGIYIIRYIILEEWNIISYIILRSFISILSKYIIRSNINSMIKLNIRNINILIIIKKWMKISYLIIHLIIHLIIRDMGIIRERGYNNNYRL
jgi:hypothetical protein